MRELGIVEWAVSSDRNGHRAIAVARADTSGLDDGQTSAVAAMLAHPQPVITVVVDDASTIQRAQGTTVDEAHVIHRRPD